MLEFEPDRYADGRRLAIYNVRRQGARDWVGIIWPPSDWRGDWAFSASSDWDFNADELREIADFMSSLPEGAP